MPANTPIEFCLRSMGPSDLSGAFALSRDFGWPHREDDWKFFLSIGEGIVAEDGGRIVGTIMGFRHGPTLSTLGMVIVDRTLQGKGLGRALVETMMARLQGSTIVLQSTENGVPLYRRLGFVEIGELFQHQGPAPAVPDQALPDDERIAPIASAERVAALYSQASQADRSRLVAALVGRDEGVVLLRNDVPAGFAMLRRFGRGWCIGPVVAVDVPAAEALILHYLRKNEGVYSRVDIADDRSLSDWLANLGLPLMDGAQTMAHGATPAAAATPRVFTLAAHALG